MRIAFFSEGQYQGKIPRNHPSMRTDLSWVCALNADHYPLYSDPPTEYDLGIFIIPKKCQDGNFDLNIWKNDFFLKRIKPKLKLIGYMQEGAQSLWQDLRIETQFSLLEFMNEADILFCHNEIDRKYYKGLISHRKVSVLQSLMIEDAIPLEVKKVVQNVNFAARQGAMIGGNMCAWYGGMDSFMIAQEFGEKIYVPSMGRRVEGEERLDGLTHLPYMNWSQWMVELSKMKYAVHLMRTYAAGTFALNCSRLKIPCISYNSLDTAIICQPDLCVDEGDLVKARKLAKHLKEDDQFYRHCSEVAYKNYQDNFTEEKFLERFFENVGENFK